MELSGTARPTSALAALLPFRLLQFIPGYPRLLAFLLPLLLPLFLFRRILPFIAQRLINASTLVVDEVEIGQVERRRMTMRMKARVGSAGAIPARIDFLGPVKLCVEDYGTRSGSLVGVSDDGKTTRATTPPSPRVVIFEGGKRLRVIGEADGMPSLTTDHTGSAVLDASVSVRVLDAAAFGAFAKTMLDSTKFSMTLVAPAVRVTALGVPIQHIKLVKTIYLRGMQRLSQIRILTAATVGGTPEHIQLMTTCEMVNVSNVTVGMGDVELGLYHEDLYRVGTVRMRNLVLAPGVNVIKAEAEFRPTVDAVLRNATRDLPDASDHDTKSLFAAATASGRRLLNSYATNVPCTVTIRGLPTSTPIPYLLPALSGLSVSTILPPESRKMILRTQLVIDPFRIAYKLQSAAKLVLFNPFQCNVTIKWMKGSVTCRDQPVGTLDENLEERNEMIELGPEAKVVSGVLGMRLRLSTASVGAVLGAAMQGAGGGVASQAATTAGKTMNGTAVKAQGRISAASTSTLPTPLANSSAPGSPSPPGATSSTTPAASSTATGADERPGLTLFEVDVVATLGCRVGDYDVELDYHQEGVPVVIGG
ncbi:hypothetical protein DFS34DRAFT_601875 [Phlyctochytrium arcticum]|nr:hypothetical protein DFS34DRAFT_601875 [Phlyctochytrium arcticum]